MPPLSNIIPSSAHSLTLAIGLSLLPFSLHAQEEESQPSTSGEIKSRILLTNGDRLTGQPHGLDAKGNLEFTSESLRGKAQFPLEKLLSLELDTWKYRERPETIARLQLQPRFRETKGDTLLGGLHELTPDSIKLDTWYGGIITVKRAMVKSLQIINSGPGSYYGPNSIKEWSFSGSTPTWEFKNGALKSVNSGAVGRDVGLTEKSHVSFQVSWKTSMSFRILLYTSDIEDVSPDACYDINFKRTYAYLRTRGKQPNGGLLPRGGGRWKAIKTPSDTNQVQLDIYTDRKSGMITVYINGKRACILQSHSPDPTNLGKGISFVSEERYPVEISSLSISPWNGTSFPDQQVALGPHGAEEKEGDKKPPHRIILKNGDEVPGTVGKVQDGRMTVETEYTPIRIPLSRIKSLSLGEIGEQPRKYKEDVRAWFHDGGHITLKLESFKDGKITGFSQAFGDISIDLNAFSKIDFHIYDPKHKEQRGRNY